LTQFSEKVLCMSFQSQTEIKKGMYSKPLS
jgi:hypothetical protein